MIAFILSMFVAVIAHAQASPVAGVAFSPPEGSVLPRDAAFVDEQGRRITLGDLLDHRPAIVVPAYFACSNLCGVMARGVASGLAASGLVAGRDVEVVVVGIDPAETSADALAKKRDTVGADAAGWHFLVGGESAVALVTRALGYRYAYDARERQFAHAAGIALTAPGGRVTHVLYGVAYSADALRAAIHGAEPAPTTTEWLLCFHYDPATGRYTMAAMAAVRLAALAALAALATFMWRTRRR
ncbi:MAG: SCO family protein [Burkholderiales bacterium]